MRVLIQMGHPAHYHLFKNLIHNLKKDGHSVNILIKKKDILEELLIHSGLEYVNILPNERKNGWIGIVVGMIIRLWKVFWFALTHHVDMLIGSSTEVAQIGWLLHKKSIVFGEDDASIIPQFIGLVAPFAGAYIAPITCNTGKVEWKTIHYAGFHKLAYLHPNEFTPNRNVMKKYFQSEREFFLLRFAQLNAYHDLNAKVHGITTEIAQRLIEILEPYGDIYITAERKLEPQFEKYRLHIDPLDIHHIMSFATLYIGDSQSMAVEAAMLGTPSLRFNDFAGKIGVLEELERKYELTYGISSLKPEVLYNKVEELLKTPRLREIFQERRQKMLADKIDVTAFFTWFIEKYPESMKIMKENPDYQYNFATLREGIKVGSKNSTYE